VSRHGGKGQHRLDLSLRQAPRSSAIGKSVDYFTTSVCHDPTHLTVALVEVITAIDEACGQAWPILTGMH
jgi:hypothetical protein